MKDYLPKKKENYYGQEIDRGLICHVNSSKRQSALQVHNIFIKKWSLCIKGKTGSDAMITGIGKKLRKRIMMPNLRAVIKMILVKHRMIL